MKTAIKTTFRLSLLAGSDRKYFCHSSRKVTFQFRLVTGWAKSTGIVGIQQGFFVPMKD